MTVVGVSGVYIFPFGVLVSVTCHFCAFEYTNFWSRSWPESLDKRQPLPPMRPPLHLGNAQWGSPKMLAAIPAKVNSPKGRSKQNSSLANDSVECSPIKKSPSPSKTTTPSSEGTKHPSLPMQQEECRGHKKSSRCIENCLLRLRSHRRIGKILQLSADVVNGYGQ